MQVLADKCQHPGCQQQTRVDHTLCGTSVLVKWTCPLGHKGRFWSSRKVNGILVNNLQTSAAILLSGCSFIKVAKMAKFLGLSFPSKSTFFRVQRLYVIPAVTEWWKWQQEIIFEELKDQDLVVAGDGQCDSPGFTAKNLCYYLMDVTTSYIIELEVLDKRETNMKSVTMEKQALQNILLRLRRLLTITEVVTDASASIKKLIGMINWIMRSYQSYKEKLLCFYENCILCTSILLLLLLLLILSLLLAKILMRKKSNEKRINDI